jgi:hypothetical protein
MTPFVTNIATRYLKYRRHSVIDHGEPVGLVALILVSVGHLLLHRTFTDTFLVVVRTCSSFI